MPPSSTVAAGGTGTYAVTVRNLHPTESITGIAAVDSAVGAASHVAVEFGLASGLSYAGRTGGAWTCTVNDAVVRCELGQLLSPAAVAPPLSVKLKSDCTGGTRTTSFALSADPLDVVLSNNAQSVSARYAVGDETPAAFSFVDVTNAMAGQVVVSKAVKPSGFTCPVQVSLPQGVGEFRINSGAYQTTPAVIAPGDKVQLRLTASSTAGETRSMAVAIGGVQDTWNVKTVVPDTTPSAFRFADVTRAVRGATVTSNAVTIKGINAAAPIAISSSIGARFSVNGGAFGSGSGTVLNGDQVRLQMTAGTTAGSVRSATLTIGGVSDTWTVKSR